MERSCTIPLEEYEQLAEIRDNYRKCLFDTIDKEKERLDNHYECAEEKLKKDLESKIVGMSIFQLIKYRNKLRKGE